MSWHMFAAMASAVMVRHRMTIPSRAKAPDFVSASAHSLEMQPAPIEPSWVIEGDPQARIAAHSKAEDQCALTGIWDCTAGTFRWFFAWDETVMILEGDVHVTAQDGTQRTLRAGDVGYFKGGTWATWQVETYVRKIAFLRKPFPAPLAFFYRLRSLLRASAAEGLAA